jgi:2-polyprenyl-3-methyl-5-hydroxy-6-metoxy-1,4-benzoquinol methylase
MIKNAHLYTLENAKHFRWASISGDLNQERLRFIREHLLGTRILDAGCGGGAYVEQLRRDGYTAVGVDRSADYLEVAKNREDRLGEYIQGDVTSLPFTDKSFDTTYCFDVLEHVDDVAALRELVRVTRRAVLIAVPREEEFLQPYGLTVMHYKDKTHLREYNEATLRELIDASGIAAVNIKIVPEGPVNFRVVLRELMKARSYSNRIGKHLANAYRVIMLRLLRDFAIPKIYTGLLAQVLIADSPQ